MAPGLGIVHVRVKALERLPYALGEIRVLQAHAQLVIGDVAEDGHCVVVKVLPAARG